MSPIPGKPDNIRGKFFNAKDLKSYKDRKARLRILIPADQFITGHVKFTAEKKPIRIRDDEFFPTGTKWGAGLDGKEQQSRRFWATMVYNHTMGMIQVWEFTQATIYNALDTLLEDDDWGDVTSYDLKVSSAGEGKDVEYSVVPVGKAELPAEIKAEWTALKETWVGLEALYFGKDPFEAFGDGTVVKTDKSDIPF